MTWLPLGGPLTESDLDFTRREGGRTGSAVSLSNNGLAIATGAPNIDDIGRVNVYTTIFESFPVSSGISVWDRDFSIIGEAIGDEFGSAVSLSGNGRRVAIGAPGHDGSGTDDGRVYIYERMPNDEWVLMEGNFDGEAAGDEFGFSVSISDDGNRLIVGAPFSDRNGDISGYVRLFEYSNGRWIQVGDDIEGTTRI